MLSWLLFIKNSLRMAIPIITLFGSAPIFFVTWFIMRFITLICFSQQIYRRWDDYLYSFYQKLVLFFFENWTHTKIYLYGDHEEILRQKENVLYISNHQSSVDWIIANMLAIRQGSLGHIRYVLKNDLKWIPLYGFYFEQHGCIYVRRNDKGDLDRVEKGIRQIRSNGLPVWLVIFPEGTRYNPEKNQDAIERSREFAQKKGVLPFDHVLYPRTGATIAAINALKDKLDAVYDITVVYSPTYDKNRQIRLAASSMIEYLQDQTKELHIHISRIPMNSIPHETNEQISDWLYQRFIIKDQLLKHFYDQNHSKDNPFNISTNQKSIQAQSTLNLTIFSILFFLLTTLMLLLTPQGRAFYLKICLFGTPISLLWMHLFPPNKFI
ncbi:unnamed protein product [Adineta steineri]|uniref:Phospholipid/glycerol acyltransferase domain-containing protein n=1 Tax=Adineta steineri TaxID=433720 RepID=A0A819BCM4_9BILA|nr:unnamed protein product [Adineta steineri]CAF3792169.1 unnamed protein product [Adineta steineri]